MAITTKLMQVEIADIGRSIYSGPCTSLVAPAAHGEVCILPRHAPFLARLNPGVITLRIPDGESQVFYVAGGYLECLDSTVTVLADQMLRSGEIDREAALAAKAEAERVLKEPHLRKERDEALREIIKALAQLRALELAQGDAVKKHRR
jgi:F-type H+-transporting ATPase subunit epsilon